MLGGNRIPFARQNGPYARASNQDMFTTALDGLVGRFGLAGPAASARSPPAACSSTSHDFNLTRECVLGSALDHATPAYDVQQACGTGLETTILVANKIALGQIEAGVAGGFDTTSDAPIEVNEDLRRLLLDLNRAKIASATASRCSPACARARSCRGSRATRSRAPACRWASTRRSRPSAGGSAARRRTSGPSPATASSPPPMTAASSTTW